VLQSSLLPQAIGFLYPGIKDAHLPPQATIFHRHKRFKKKKPRSYRHKRLGLEMLHLPHLKQQSPAAVKKNLRQ
jgi:hypothetical protein